MSLDRLEDAGFVRRNGSAFCGMCRAVDDAEHGGRARRRQDGWSYHSDAFGWICPSCSRWVREQLAATSSRQKVSRPSTTEPSVRGFGLKAQEFRLLSRKGARRRKAAATRARERELRAAGLEVPPRPKSGRKGSRRARRPEMLKKTAPGRFVSWSSSTA